MAYYLIDFENVKSRGMEGVELLTEEDTVCIFYSDNADSMTFDLHRKLNETKADIIYHKVAVGTKNALDFQLATYLGYLICEQQREGIHPNYFIVTKDNGFTSLMVYWKAQGVPVRIIRNLLWGKNPAAEQNLLTEEENEAETVVTTAEDVAEQPEPAEETKEPMQLKTERADAPEEPTQPEPVKEPQEPVQPEPEKADASEEPTQPEPEKADASEEPTQPEPEKADASEEPTQPEPETVDEPAQPVKKPSGKKSNARKKSTAKTDDKTAEKKSAEKKPTEKKPAEKKPAEKKPAEKKPAEKKPAEELDELTLAVEKVLTDQAIVPQVVKFIRQYKTKQGINNALNKEFKDSKRTSEIYSAIKPLIADKKGK